MVFMSDRILFRHWKRWVLLLSFLYAYPFSISADEQCQGLESFVGDLKIYLENDFVPYIENDLKPHISTKDDLTTDDEGTLIFHYNQLISYKQYISECALSLRRFSKNKLNDLLLEVQVGSMADELKKAGEIGPKDIGFKWRIKSVEFFVKKTFDVIETAEST